MIILKKCQTPTVLSRSRQGDRERVSLQDSLLLQIRRPYKQALKKTRTRRGEPLLWDSLIKSILLPQEFNRRKSQSQHLSSKLNLVDFFLRDPTCYWFRVSSSLELQQPLEIRHKHLCSWSTGLFHCHFFESWSFPFHFEKTSKFLNTAEPLSLTHLW